MFFRYRRQQMQEQSSSDGNTSFYAPRMNLTGWYSGGAAPYWSNPASPGHYRPPPRAYEHRAQGYLRAPPGNHIPPQFVTIPRPQYNQNITSQGWNWNPSQ